MIAGESTTRKIADGFHILVCPAGWLHVCALIFCQKKQKTKTKNKKECLNVIHGLIKSLYV